MQKWVIAILLFTALGCSGDPKAATEKNFVKAINTFFDQNPCYSTIADMSFPFEINDGQRSFKRKSTYLNAFVDIGFLTKSEKTDTVQRSEQRFTFSQTKETVQQTTITYDLTEEGKKYYRENAKSVFIGNPVNKALFREGSNNGFYCGQFTVNKIERFTEPVEFMGKKVCEVHCRITTKDAQSWVTNQEVQNADRDVKSFAKLSTNPESAKINLILTNNGWVHEALLR